MAVQKTTFALIALAAAVILIVPPAQAQGEPDAAQNSVTQYGLPYQVADFIADMRRDETGEGIYAKTPREAAPILLDLLLSEDVMQLLLAEPSLREDFQRSAATLHGEIAQAFTDALAGDIKSRAKAMLWADGLMRLAPLKPDAPVRRLEWERASRVELAKALYAEDDDRQLYRLYRDFAQQRTGSTLEQQVSDDNIKAFMNWELFGNDDLASFRHYSEEQLAVEFWMYTFVVSKNHSFWEERLKLADAIDYFRAPIALNRFISGEEYFRPILPFGLFKGHEGQTVTNPDFPPLLSAILQIWGIWLEQQDAATEQAVG